MGTLGGYRLETPLTESRRGAIVYKAIRLTDGRAVILKVVRSDAPMTERKRLQAELEIGRKLVGPSLLRPLALETVDGQQVLVLEDFDGVFLSTLLDTPLALPLF